MSMKDFQNRSNEGTIKLLRLMADAIENKEAFLHWSLADGLPVELDIKERDFKRSSGMVVKISLADSGDDNKLEKKALKMFQEIMSGN